MSPRFIDKSIHNIDLRRKYHEIYNGNGLYVLNTQRKTGSLIRNPKIKDDFRSVMHMNEHALHMRRQTIIGMMNGEDMLFVEGQDTDQILPSDDILVIPSGMLGKGYTFENN